MSIVPQDSSLEVISPNCTEETHQSPTFEPYRIFELRQRAWRSSAGLLASLPVYEPPRPPTRSPFRPQPDRNVRELTRRLNSQTALFPVPIRLTQVMRALQDEWARTGLRH